MQINFRHLLIYLSVSAFSIIHVKGKDRNADIVIYGATASGTIVKEVLISNSKTGTDLELGRFVKKVIKL